MVDTKTQQRTVTNSELYGSAMHLAVYLGRKKIIDLLANVRGLLNLSTAHNPQNTPANVKPLEGKNHLVTKIESLTLSIKNGDVLGIAEFSLANVEWLTMETHGNTPAPMQVAVESNQANALDFITSEIAQYRNISKTEVLDEPYKGVTLAAMAITAGHEDILRYLINNEIDITKKTKSPILTGGSLNDITLLALACFLKKNHMVELLLAVGAEVNVLCGDYSPKYTALDCAIISYELELVVMLLQNGAKIDGLTEDTKSKGSLALATHIGCDDVIDLLLGAGAKIDPPFLRIVPTDAKNQQLFSQVNCQAINKYDYFDDAMKRNGLYLRLTQLLEAIARGDLNRVKAFIAQNTNWLTLASPVSHLTPLGTAVKHGTVDILDVIATELALLFGQTKAQVLSQEVERGKSPLCYAIEYGHLHIILYLVRMGVDTNPKSNSFLHPLSRAAHTNNGEVIDALLRLGGDLAYEIEDDSGKKRLPHQVPTQDKKPNILNTYVIEFRNALRSGNIDIVDARIRENHSWLRLPLNDAKQTAWHFAAAFNQNKLLASMVETTIMSSHLTPEEYRNYRLSKVSLRVVIPEYLIFKINQIRQESRISELDEADGMGFTPLQYCAFNKEPDIFVLLSGYSVQYGNQLTAQRYDLYQAVAQSLLLRVAGFTLQKLSNLNKYYPASLSILEEPIIRELFKSADDVATYIEQMPQAIDPLLADIRLRLLIKNDVKAIARLVVLLPHVQLQKHHDLLLTFMTLSQCNKLQTVAAEMSPKYREHKSQEHVTRFLNTELDTHRKAAAGMLARGCISLHGFFRQPQDVVEAKKHYQNVLSVGEIKEKIQALFELIHLYNADAQPQLRDDAIEKLLQLCDCYLRDELYEKSNTPINDYDTVIRIQQSALSLRQCFSPECSHYGQAISSNSSVPQ